MHDDVRAIATATGVTYSLDVILCGEKRIIAAFGGDILEMHAAAARTAKQLAMKALNEPFDVVVTTGSGYPLDQNLYQPVKGMSAASQVVRPGGTIAHLTQTGDVSAAVAAELRRAGPGSRECVIPEGPQTIPYLAAG